MSNEIQMDEVTKELLAEGNRARFAEEYIRRFPVEAKKYGITLFCYRSGVIEFNDGVFVVRLPNGDKHFFDTAMNFLGEKIY